MQTQAPGGKSRGARGRILFLTSCPEVWGGSEELWAGAALHLHQRGYRIQTGRSDFPDRGPLHPKWAELRMAGVGVRDFKIGVLDRLIPDAFFRFFPSKAGRIFHLRNRWLAQKIRYLVPDLVVISQGGTYDAMTWVNVPQVCHLARTPYVLICQKSAETEWPPDYLRDAHRDCFTRAERVFFVSHHNQRITEQQLGMALDHGEVVRNPYMVKTTEPLPWPAVGENGPFKLACVGRMWPREKGQDVLLNVLAREKWQTRPIEVSFFGAGLMARGLQEMAQFLGLKNTHFLGFKEDITGVWRDHHALVLSSRTEGLPLAQVEAMICGRPVIVATAGGSAEIMREGETGFLAASATEDAMDDALERARHRRHEWESLGLNAARHISACYPGDPCSIFADKIEALQGAVVERRQNSPGTHPASQVVDPRGLG